MGSLLVMGVAGLLSRAFLKRAKEVKVQGLDEFIQLLDRRSDIGGRERGLITGGYLPSLVMGCRTLRIRRSTDGLFFSPGQSPII